MATRKLSKVTEAMHEDLDSGSCMASYFQRVSPDGMA
jgi:hypothetical protein